MQLPKTRDDFDLLFQRLQEPDYVARQRATAAELLRIGRESEQFRAVIGGFLGSLLQSVGPMGINPEPLSRTALLMFSMGAEYSGQPQIEAASKPSKLLGLANTVCSLAVIGNVTADAGWQERWDAALADLSEAVLEES